MHYFEVAQRGPASRTPIHNILSAVDQSLLVQPYERFLHCDRQAVVHREVLALPIHTGAQALHLVKDGVAVLLLPLPHALQEGVAPELLARFAFAGKLALHHHLCSDAGVVRARQPKRGLALHAVPADEDVHLRLV